MLRMNGLRLTIDQPFEHLSQKVCRQLHIPGDALLDLKIVKESIDARKRNEIYFIYTVDITVADEQTVLAKHGDLVKPVEPYVYEMPDPGSDTLKHRPVVAGFGPAGMFAALLLAQAGLCPIVLERGDAVDDRVAKVNRFWTEGILDSSSNVQFGEGGAGTFSDGKLTTRVKDLRAQKVLMELVKAGAPQPIQYEAHPHIGTDHLREIVKNIRKEIIALGGEVRFRSQLDGIEQDHQKLTGIFVNQERIPCEQLILAIGHSARDTFQMLYDSQIEMIGKPFAVGVRIEHPQRLIDEAQYGKYAGHPRLKAAEYRLTHRAGNGRGVYTFCMCPGGFVVPSASTQGQVVVNGMSEYARDQANANSAVLVQVSPDDFGTHPLDGVRYQEQLERKAFTLGGENYHAPVQLVKDFLNHQASTKLGSIKPSYAIGVTPCDLRELFDQAVQQGLEDGLLGFDRQLKGFAMGDAVMTAVESRSSSPLRILRTDDTYESLTLSGMHPCGEGAGYAGGIVSAAIDGIRCAEAILKKYHR